MNRIKLRKIKFSEWMSEETNCFKAEILFDGKLVGMCENEGRGGSTYCYPSSIETKLLFATAEDYCKSLPPIEYGPMFNMEAFTVDSNLENVVDRLFEIWLTAKDEKKKEKDYEKGICFTKFSGSYRVRQYRMGTTAVKISDMMKDPKGKDMLKKDYDMLISGGYKVLNTNLNF